MRAGGSDLSHRIGDEQRNGSIAAIALVLGFSLSFTAAWGLDDEPWSWRDLVVAAVAAGGIMCQLSAFMRVFALPNLSIDAHTRATAVFRFGVIAVLVAYALHIALDASCDLAGLLCG